MTSQVEDPKDGSPWADPQRCYWPLAQANAPTVVALTPRAALLFSWALPRALVSSSSPSSRTALLFVSLSLLLSLTTTLAQWLVVGCWFYPSRNTCSVGVVVVRGLVVYSPDPNRRRETLTTRRMRASRDDAARRSLAPRASRLAPRAVHPCDISPSGTTMRRGRASTSRRSSARSTSPRCCDAMRRNVVRGRSSARSFPHRGGFERGRGGARARGGREREREHRGRISSTV